jgi:1-phosphofructokinase family hexose kinase
MIFSTLYNPSIDVCYVLDNLQLGTTMLDVPSAIYPSGKGLNVAKTIKALGEEVVVTGIVPADDYQRFTRYLNSLGIGHSFIKIEGGARINVTISDTSNRHVTHVNSTSNQLSTRIQDEVHECVRSSLRQGDFCVMSGSLPPGFDAKAYANLIEYCRQKDILTCLDTRGTPLTMGIRGRPAIVKPNIEELEAFFGEQIQGVRHIALKGKRLIDLGVSYVFISLGADGMIAIHEDDCLLCSIPSMEVVDPVGCGDALVAGIVVGHVRKFSFHETCRMAVACATSNALHIGPGMIDRMEVGKLMEEVVIEAV